jgi:hypothetical protein
MGRRPDLAIVLLACGGTFVLYYSAFATDLEFRCPSSAVSACGVYWGLDGLSWGAGVAALGLSLLLVAKPRTHALAGALPLALSVGFLASVAFLFRVLLSGIHQYSGVLFLFVLIFLWPYFVVAVGGILALVWKPSASRSRPLPVPVAWPPPPSGVRPPG